MKHRDHRKRIERIANELDVPSWVVRQVYFSALRELSSEARIHDYLHLFVAKRVHRELRSRRPELIPLVEDGLSRHLPMRSVGL